MHLLSYVYDGTLEGFLSCIFEIYSRQEVPDEIVPVSGQQLRIEQDLRTVQTHEEHWQRVQKGIYRKLGNLTWEKVRSCYCASIPEKELLLYRYLAHGFAQGRSAINDLSHEDVLPVEDLYREIGRETQRMVMFARFAKIPEGVYCATINPKHNVLPLIMSHFAARFNVQDFIIFDEVHELAGLSQRGQWYLADAHDVTIPEADSDDLEYQRLWKKFYDAIAIPERRNEKVRRQFMPKRLWKNLPELKVSTDGG